MSESEPGKGWWHTLPGILTGITAFITAVAGLILAINQTGWLSRPHAEAPPVSAAPAPAETSGDMPMESRAPRTVSLQGGREHRLSGATFILLGTRLSQRTSETYTLTLRMRMLNEGRYPANFWDDEFRLFIDGVPRSPNSGLNETVNGQAARDGDVTFVVPASATDVKLRIVYSGEQADIPLKLGF
jgi:hypothetical protein